MFQASPDQRFGRHANQLPRRMSGGPTSSYWTSVSTNDEVKVPHGAGGRRSCPTAIGQALGGHLRARGATPGRSFAHSARERDAAAAKTPGRRWLERVFAAESLAGQFTVVLRP